MFPIQEETLTLQEISGYWVREISPPASLYELIILLEQAWWRGELVEAGEPRRLGILRTLFEMSQSDILFLVGDDPGPQVRWILDDGGEELDIRPHIRVPSNSPKDWTKENCASVFDSIAAQWTPNWVENTNWIRSTVELALRDTLIERVEFFRWFNAAGYRPQPNFWGDVSEAHLQAPLPESSGQHLDTAEPTGTKPLVQKSKGGRPPKYAWEAAQVEILRVADLDGLPKTQAELVRHLLDWFNTKFNQHPDESEVKRFVSRYYGQLRATGWAP